MDNSYPDLLRPSAVAAEARRVYGSCPTSADDALRLGRVFEGLESWPDALACYERATALAPALVDAHLNAAHMNERLLRVDAARRSSEAALRLSPDASRIAHFLGYVLAEHFGRLAEAEELFLRAIRSRPGWTEGYVAAFGRRGLEQPLDAFVSHVCATIGDQVRKSTILAQLAVMFMMARDRDRARRCSAAVFAMDSAKDLGACADVYAWLGEFDRVDRCYDRIREALVPLPTSLLKGHLFHLCRFERYDAARALLRRHFPLLDARYRANGHPLWDDRVPPGSHVVVHCPDGFGDTIQFARFAQIIRERGGRPTVLCRPLLATVVASIPGIERVAHLAAQYLPALRRGIDYGCIAELVILLVDGVWETLGDRVSYMTPPRERRRAWERLIPETNDLKVGLVWIGGSRGVGAPLPSVTAQRFTSLLADRALPGLSAYLPLARVPHVRWYSLQCGAAAGEASPERAPFPIVDLSPHLHDFGETAAAVARLDAVVTIDTSVAHLAGALGKPCYVALHDSAYWLFGVDGRPCRWYPSMRLFRQVRPGEWSDVIDRIGAALTQMSAEHCLLTRSFV